MGVYFVSFRGMVSRVYLILEGHHDGVHVGYFYLFLRCFILVTLLAISFCSSETNLQSGGFLDKGHGPRPTT